MSDVVWGLVGLAVLLFMFHGEPDAYDKLHEYVMHINEVKK